MPIIDAHVHLYPPGVDLEPQGWAAAHGERLWGVLCTRRRRDGRPVQTLPTVDELLRTMDADGVARAVLQGWYWEKAETCGSQNRFYAACVRAHPDRLSAFATVHPGAGSAATREELKRARGEGLVGIGELSPHSQGYAVTDPVFGEVLEFAAEGGMPVTLHVTDPSSRAYPGRVATPLADFVFLAREHPRTTFVLAHWGGLLPWHEAGATPAELPNIYYDTAASPLIYDAGVWPRMLALVGTKRVLFGSDYPLNLYPKQEDVPGLTRLVAEARAGGADAQLLGGTAARLLGLT